MKHSDNKLRKTTQTESDSSAQSRNQLKPKKPTSKLKRNKPKE
jgi:hypothetical protein